MTNSTDTFWEVDGVSLQTYAYNIVTLGGTRDSVPPLRGEDTVVPYRVGKLPGTRIPDSQTITLGMWVQGCLANGNIPEEASMRNLYNRNWRKLKHLLWQPNNEFVITKRFEDDDGNIVVASGKGRYAGGLEPGMTGPYRAVFTVDILMADPFFYGAQVTETFTAGQTKLLTVPGDYATYDIEADLADAGRLTNNSANPPAWMQLSKAGTAKVKDFTVLNSTGGVLTHGGALQWFLLNNGDNSVTATKATTLRYRPAYV